MNGSRFHSLPVLLRGTIPGDEEQSALDHCIGILNHLFSGPSNIAGPVGCQSSFCLMKIPMLLRPARAGGEQNAQRNRQRQHPLAHRHRRDDAIDQVGGGFRHAPCAAGGAKAALLTGKGNQLLMGELAAAQAQKPVRTTLYQLVQEHIESFLAQVETEGGAGETSGITNEKKHNEKTVLTRSTQFVHMLRVYLGEWQDRERIYPAQSNPRLAVH